MSDDDAAVGAPEHLHPLFLLTGLGGRLRGLLGAYAGIAYLAARGSLGTALLAAIGVFLATAAALVLYWRRFEFRVGDNEIRIDSGIFSRTHRSIPFERIQDVEIAQGPLARLLGLAEVKFETGAAAGAKADEGVLQAIKLERAEALRALVRSKRADAAAIVGQQPDEEERPPVYAMDLPRLLLAGLFNFSLAIFAGLFGLTQTFGDVLGFDPLSRAFWTSVLSTGTPLAEFLLAHRIAAAAAGLASLALIGIATGILRTVVRDFRFRLDKTGRGLRRRRGLFTLTDVTVAVARAQALIVGSGPVRESFGWRELKLQSLARDEGSGDHVLAPLATAEEVDEIVQALGWRAVPRDAAWQRVSSAFAWASTIAAVPLLLLALAQSAVAPPLGFALLVAVLLWIALRWLAWSRSRYALDGDRLLIRTGWWRQRLLVLPLRRIQSIDLTQNFVTRRFGTAGLTFGVAGGSGFSAHRIPAVAAERARALRDQLISSAP